jgi:hypothetical protein
MFTGGFPRRRKNEQPRACGVAEANRRTASRRAFAFGRAVSETEHIAWGLDFRRLLLNMYHRRDDAPDRSHIAVFLYRP